MSQFKLSLTKEDFYLTFYFLFNIVVFFLLATTNYILWPKIYYLPSLMTLLWISLLLVAFAFFIVKAKEEILKKQIKLILFLAFVIFIFLIILPPVTSADIYQYIFQAKIFNVYQQNPYLVAPNHFANDPLLANVSGPQYPSMYGPVWTSLVVFYNLLSGQNIALNVILLKLNNLLFLILTAVLIFKLLKKFVPGYEYKGLTFLLLNPIILYEILLDGHNDFVMIFFLVASLYFLLNRKYIYVLPFLILSVLIKYITIIALPFILLYWLFEPSPWRQKAKDLIISSVVSLAIILVSWWPFYKGLATFQGLFMVAKINSNFLVYFLNNLFAYFHFSPDVYKIFLLVVFGLGYIALWLNLLKRLLKKNLTAIKFIYLILCVFFIYLVFASFWLQTWYILILIPFVALLIADQELFISFNIFYIFLLLYFVLITNHYI